MPAVLNACVSALVPAGAAKVSHVSGNVHCPLTESPASGSEMLPLKVRVVPLATTCGVDGERIDEEGAWFVVPVTLSCQMPRPCVATRTIAASSVTCIA